MRQGRAARHDGFRATRAAACNQQIAIALDEADFFEWHAQFLDNHLRESGGMALAEIKGSGQQSDGAVFLEADAAHLVHGRGGHLKILPDADPAQQALTGALFAAFAEAFVIRSLKRFFQNG